MVCSIQAIDEGAKHIAMSQTSAADVYAIFPDGTTLYMTYSISGNSLYLLASDGGYPPSATAGPYIRQ